MFCFMFGIFVGAGSYWFVTRFRDALKIAKTNLEKKIEDNLKK